ncbi:MAG: hypothetical protein AB1Z50_02450, partial [Desulfuromonadales bacterium]
MSVASFSVSGFNPLVSGNPAAQGKASGALFLLTLFGQTNKVRRLAGRNPPVLFLIFDAHNDKIVFDNGPFKTDTIQNGPGY